MPTACDTLAWYRTIERRLRDRAGADLDLPGDAVAPAEVVHWLRGRPDRYRLATLRAYRTALRAVWRHDRPRGWEEGLRRLAGLPMAEARRPGHDGCVHKAKALPEADARRLFGWLEAAAARGETAARLAAAMLEVGRVVGLRPGEWAGAWLEVRPDAAPLVRAAAGHAVADPTLAPGRVVLVVPTLKWRLGHGEPHLRRLEVGHLPPALLHELAVLLRLAREAAAAHHGGELLAQARRALRRAQAELWPRRRARYALSSARHACAAALKRRLGRAEVAAVMGHASDRTAGRSYARAASGNPGAVLPVPDPASVAAVRASPCAACRQRWVRKLGSG